MNFQDDTIVALATPSGVGAISVIRISGDKSYSAVDKIFVGKNKISECDSHTIHYGKIFDIDGELIDDVLVSVFRKPHSYTGEDSVEISAHGSPHIVQKIIELLLAFNVRVAEPGEFTKRAFLNGKMDLSQAEAVVDIINSRTKASFRGARNQFDGILSSKINELRSKLMDVSSLVELELDFAEEDLEFVSRRGILDLIENIIKEIEALLATYKFGRVIRDGVNVAIVGEPNVGKSSLLNYILKESRAIVSEIPGTTRDVIREEAVIDGILFRLFDTAGIQETNDNIEKEGIKRSQNMMKESDIVIFLNESTNGLSKELREYLFNNFNREKIITVVNKIDLYPEDTTLADVKISAKTGSGINTLYLIMKERALGSQSYSEYTTIITSLRHSAALNRCKENLINSMDTIKKRLSGEYISADLRLAVDSLDEIIGKVTSEEILNNIFNKFCIGK